eukprot:GEMP01009139.1.p1 GENE.GEMP01009139.1~~GEMP01009139.1.p1  ORF type:complete len:380 (+),score=80.49 GEMP01009139.1:110-1249(+)
MHNTGAANEVVVSLLYGRREDLFVAALVLGSQLRDVRREKVLLLGPPLPEEEAEDHPAGRIWALKEAGWDVRRTELINVPHVTHYSKLHYVMTKLRVFEVFPEGTELLFLDLDVFIAQPSVFDEMFRMESPAAKYHGYGPEVNHDDKVSFFTFWWNHACINAGVMRLRSNPKLFVKMMNCLAHFTGGGALPEQYFLVSGSSSTWNFFESWTNMKEEWNLEVDHRVNFDGQCFRVYDKLIGEPAIFHFSCTWFKPWYFTGLNDEEFDLLSLSFWEAPDFTHAAVTKFAQNAARYWLEELEMVKVASTKWGTMARNAFSAAYIHLGDKAERNIRDVEMQPKLCKDQFLSDDTDETTCSQPASQDSETLASSRKTSTSSGRG